MNQIEYTKYICCWSKGHMMVMVNPNVCVCTSTHQQKSSTLRNFFSNKKIRLVHGQFNSHRKWILFCFALTKKNSFKIHVKRVPLNLCDDQIIIHKVNNERREKIDYAKNKVMIFSAKNQINSHRFSIATSFFTTFLQIKILPTNQSHYDHTMMMWMNRDLFNSNKFSNHITDLKRRVNN